MSVLSYESLPKEARADFDWMHADGFTFQVDDYFKLKGLADRVVCGIFENRTGKQGRFLLVLEKRVGEPWKKAFLHEEAGEAGFSVLVARPAGLYWGTCMQCEEFSQLRFRKKEQDFFLDEAP
jgi:hypothetical protein